MVTKHEILRKQRSRTMQARAQDAVRTSKEVSKRTDKKAVEKWMKHPGRIDLRAVDTKGRGKGWYEEKNPLTEKAPIHQEVALKKRVYESGSVYQPQHKIVPGLVNEINKIEDKIEVLEEKKEAIKEVIKEEKKEEKVESWTPIKIQKDFEGKSTKEIEKVLDFESDKRDELNEILTKVLNKKGIKYNTWKDEKGKDKADLPIEIDISKTLEDNLKIVMSKVEKGKIVGFFEEEEREKPIREARQKKERQEREKLTKLSEEDRKVLTTEWERYLPEAKKQGFTKEELLKTPTIPGKTGFSDRWTLPKLKNFSFNDNKIRAVLKKLEKERPPNEEYAYASVQLIKEILGGTGDQKLVEDRKTQAKEVLRPYNLKDVNKWKKNYLHEKDDNVDLENIDTKKK